MALAYVGAALAAKILIAVKAAPTITIAGLTIFLWLLILQVQLVLHFRAEQQLGFGIFA